MDCKFRFPPVAGLQGAAFRLAHLAACGVRVGFPLSTGHAQAEAFQSLHAAFLAPCVAFADIRLSDCRILPQAGFVGFPVAAA